MRWQRGWVETEGARGKKRYIGRYRDGEGRKPKVHLGYLSEMTLTEARTKLEAIIREIGSTPAQLAHQTLSEYWQLTFKPRHRVRWGEPTEAGYERYMQTYLAPAFGDVVFRDITPELITSFFEKMRKKGRSKWVVNKCWTMLNSILEDALDDDILAKSPMRKCVYPKTREPERPVIDTGLIPRALELVADDPYESAVLHVGIFCAMRAAEIWGLSWSAFRDDHFLIRDSAWKGKVLRNNTKTGQHAVFIPPATQAAILRWREVATFKRPDDILFASQDGTPMSANNFRNRVMAPLAEQLGIRSLSFQILRRSHATRNQAAAKDEQGHLGHKHITTTLGLYAQEIPASVRAMVERDEANVLGKRKANFLSSESVAPKLPLESDVVMV